MTHTEGPWRFNQNYLDVITAPASVLQRPITICRNVGIQCSHNHHRIAIGHLISAAPDLLDHLDSIIKSYDKGELEAWEIELARKVVAKAEGK